MTLTQCFVDHAIILSVLLLLLPGQAVAFLEAELPLELVVSTPVELSDGSSSVQLQGRQAITAVFSRPVIALGSDFAKEGFGDKVPFSIACSGQSLVPGKARWATTYIARFDPDIDWPSDLSCSLQWNDKLTTYDGVPFKAPTVRRVALTSSPMSISVTNVESELASKATDGFWDATTGGELPEVPPDGNITVQFTNAINLVLIQTTFVVFRSTGADKYVSEPSITATVLPCPEVTSRPIPFFASAQPTTKASSQCAVVKLKTALATGTKYRLCINKGTKYYEYSGPLAEQACAGLEGLRRFNIPFNDFKDSTVQLRRWDLWLRHGLASGLTANSFASVISITGPASQPVNFTMSLPNKATLRLSVPSAQPETSYQVQIKASNSIKDAFGLPLLASQTSFKMDVVNPAFAGPQGYMNSMALFEPSGGNPVWPYIAYGSDKFLKAAAYWNFNRARLVKFFANVYGVNTLVNLNTIMGPPDFQLDRPTDKQFNLVKLRLRGKGPWLVHTCCQEIQWPVQGLASTEWEVIQKSGVQASAIVSAQAVTMLLTDVRTGRPVGNLPVDLYATKLSSDGLPNQVFGPFSAISSSFGVATFEVSKLAGFDVSSQLHAVVKPINAPWIILPSIGSRLQDSTTDLSASLFLDRELVKPGETLKVAGYIRKATSNGFVIPTQADLQGLGISAIVSPSLSGESDNGPQTVPFTYDATYGRITINGPTIPADAKLRSYTIAVTMPPTSGGGDLPITAGGGPVLKRPGIGFITPIFSGTNLAIQSFTVADPRPPTVDLTVTAPAWTRSGSSAIVSLEAVSYLGTQVASSIIGVTWRLNNFVGGANLTTDANGKASATINLATFDPKPAVGDVISIEATWIGPTRERVVRSDSITVANGPYTITLEPLSWRTDLPGAEFGVVATLISLETEQPVLGKTVQVTLLPNGTTVGPTATCSVVSGVKDYSKCRLKLPNIGDFLLRGCVDGACGIDLQLGKNATKWKEEPYTAFDSLSLLSDKENYTTGQVARLAFEYPFPATAWCLAVWGNNRGKAMQVFPIRRTGLNYALLPLGPECVGTCAVNVIINVPRLDSYSSVPAVPTNKLFDPRAPHTISMTTTLNVPEDRTLKVDLTVPPVLAPGESGSIKVSVSKANKPVVGSQVTVLAVDKAILDLLPYPLQDLSSKFRLTVAAVLSSKNWDVSRVSQAIIDRAFSDDLKVLGIDPWAIGVGPKVVPDPFPSPDPTPEEIINSTSFQLSPFPSRILFSGPRIAKRVVTGGGPLFSALPMASAPAPASDSARSEESASVGSGSSSGAQPRLQSDFQTTPLYTVVTTKTDGTGGVTLKAPSNLGEFVVRAYAATGADTQFGAGEANLIVRRRVSLTPSVPRFVRVGDKLTAGVVVTVPGTGAALSLKVTMKPDTSGVLTPATAATKSLQLAGGQQAEVRFDLVAAKVGNANLTFSVSGADKVAVDSVILNLQVVTKQEGLVVATSFAMRPNGTAVAWKEGLQLPAAIPEVSSLDLTAGVGNLPSVQAMFNELKKRQPQNIYGYWAVAVAIYDAVLSTYSTRPANAEAQVIPSAVQAVQRLTNDNLGLLPYQPGVFSFNPTRTDIPLNTWAIWLVKSFPGANQVLKASVPTWQSAVERQLVRDAKNEGESKPPRAYSDFYSLAWARLVFGSQKAFTDEEPIKSDLAFSRLTANITTQPSEIQYLVALTLLSEGATQADPIVDKVAKSILSNIRVAARTAYVAAAPGSASAAGASTQALALLVLVKAKINNQLVPKLAAYVASGPRSFAGPLTVYRSEVDIGTSFNALSTYDVAAGSGNPDLQLVATAGSKELLRTSFNSSFVGPVTSSTPWTALGTATTLGFQATGRGEASVAALLSFTPAEVPTTPSYRGIWVERSVQLISGLNNLPIGGPLQGVPLSSTVAISVQITSPDDLDQVTVRVLMPAGLEPIDPNMFTDSAAQLTCSLGGDDFSTITSFFRWWWWPACPAQETAPQVVTFQYQRLLAGTSTIRFIAVAATPGTFLFPPTKAFATQQPEVLGLTAGSTFTVCENCKAVSAPTPAALKACPKNCSGNGNCNLTTGACTCDSLFTGADCAQTITS